MDPYLRDVLDVLLRMLHVVAGIAWNSFKTIVATIETTTINPTGTKTLTLSDFQWSVKGSRSTPRRARTSAPTPSRASTRALPRSTLPAVSIRRA